MFATQLKSAVGIPLSQIALTHTSHSKSSSRVSALNISSLLSAGNAETEKKSFLAYLWTPFAYIGALLSKIWEKFLNVILWRTSKSIDMNVELKVAPFQELLKSLEDIQNDPEVLKKWQGIWNAAGQPVREALITHDGLELAKNTLMKEGKREEEIDIEDLKANFEANKTAYRETSMDLFANLDLKNGALIGSAVNTVLAILNKKIELLKEGSI